MDLGEARLKLRELLGSVNPSELPNLLNWMRNSDELDQLLVDNNKVILQSIAEDLRARLPIDAMLPSETAAQNKMQLRERPTVHVDSFLYSDEQVDSLCQEGAMSRNYCLSCGSLRTAPLDFISHSFSMSELQFLFQNLLPDLSGRTVVDVGSRLGAVLYGGYVYSSASRLIGLELSEDFVRLQNDMLHKYRMADRVQVLHANVCTQEVLLQGTDVLIMNNVFEYFMEPSEQTGAWKFIMKAFRKRGSLLVTVPSLQESLDALQAIIIKITCATERHRKSFLPVAINLYNASLSDSEPPSVPLPPGWVEELPVDYNVYLGRDTDPEDLRQIHLYRVV